MTTYPLTSRFALLGSIAFANEKRAGYLRLRKLYPSQVQVAFRNARAKALSHS